MKDDPPTEQDTQPISKIWLLVLYLLEDRLQNILAIFDLDVQHLCCARFMAEEYRNMDKFCVTQTTIRRLLYNMKINNISCDKMGVVILFVFFM